MGRELRLGFAMGGGVSLGTFAGGALSEALKLAILRARDENGERYDRVVVDVFSGASAGAMTLGLMLRTLAHRTQEDEAAAEARLRQLFGAEFDAIEDAEVRQNLIAAQVVQDMQTQVWARDISLDKLLASGNSSMRSEVGILDRKAVEDIACRRISFNGQADLSGRRLLGGGPKHDRVLFACTLSNVSPILVDATSDLNAMRSTGFVGLADGLTSRVHRELRIFDLNFRPVPKKDTDSDRYPERWCRYHVAAEKGGRIGDLTENKTWSKITATCIAAGAFPFAFEPVVLTRSDYEFGNIWPKTLSKKGIEKHPFTYIDGGTFNNEPIREAFRLAAFLDAHNLNRDFDRWLIFVDPNAKAPEDVFRVSFHQAFDLRASNLLGTFDGVDLVKKPSIDRLVPYVGSLIGAILNEARSIEGDKIYQTRKRFELRDNVRRFIFTAVRHESPGDLIEELISFVEERLEQDAVNSLLPAGTLTAATELERVLAEEERERPEVRPLRGTAEAFVGLSPAERAADPNAGLWLRMLMFTALDYVMDLEGKHPNTQLIAVAPYTNLVGDGKPKPIDLPGSRVLAFGGFTSNRAREYEVAVARRCAHEFLTVCGVIQSDDDLGPVPSFEHWDEYRAELRQGMSLLADRVGSMIRQSHLLPPGPLKLALPAVASFIQGKIAELALEKAERVRHEFRVLVPGSRYEIDGRGLGDQDVRPIRLDGTLYLLTYADYDPSEGRWIGPFIDEGAQRIDISYDGRGFLPDRRFCTIELPDSAQCEEAACLPHPIFMAEIDETKDKGKTLKAERWDKIDPGVSGLEKSLFGPSVG